MDKELSGKLVEILGAMQSAVGQAKDFTLSQLPDIAQSYVMYGRVWSLIMFVFFLTIFVITIVAIRRIAPKTDDRYFVYAIGGVLSMLPAAGAIASLKNVILVWVAPKVWLLIKLSEIMSGK